MKPPVSQIPISLIFLLIVIAVVNGVAEAYHWYWTMRWFDMPMHYLGGVWLAGMGVWWVFFRKGIRPQSFLHGFIVSILVAFSIGLLWEVYEAVVSFVTVGAMNNIYDTLGDIFFDILGGVTVAIFIWRNKEVNSIN